MRCTYTQIVLPKGLNVLNPEHISTEMGLGKDFWFRETPLEIRPEKA